VIELKDLSAGYDGNCILSHVEVCFHPGELTVIVGPNGSGKSTLIRTALGLNGKLGGEVLIDGQPLETVGSRKLAQKAAYMAQSRPTPNIKARRMVLHGRFPYLSYPRKYRQEDFCIADKAMQLADCTELAHREMSELSGGQRQKVYLAMALAQEPETLFMDEPCTYLDASHQIQLMELARELAGAGRAVVMVLHDLCQAMRWADRIVVVDEGRIISQGSPEQIYSEGILNSVFKVRLARVLTDGGWQYYYDIPQR